MQEWLAKNKKLQDFRKNVRAKYSKFKSRFLNLFSVNYFGIRLPKVPTLILGYTLLIAGLYATLAVAPTHYVEVFAYIDFTQQIPTILTVLLTVLLSAALVFLIDDTKGWSLARVTIIRYIVRLKGLVISSITILLISITPDYQLNDHSLRVWVSPILIAAFIFIIGIFVRIFRWLNDLAADPGLFENDNSTDSRLFTSKSYRFARIVHLIRETNQRDAWQAILERTIPDGYEELIHDEFFKSANKIVKNKKNDKLLDLSIRLEIYDKYFERRNLDSWRFYLDYSKQFLLLYSAIDKIANNRSVDKRSTMVWRGKSALERILKRLFEGALNRDYAWDLVEAMDKYIVDSDLNKLPRANGPRQTVALSHFIDELLESLYQDRTSIYDIGHYLQEKEYWLITYNNLYENRYNVSFVVLKHFEEWLFSKLDKENDDESLFNIDLVMEILFQDADPIEMGCLYWFMYKAKNTTNSQLIIDMIYDQPRGFGIIGRSYSYTVVDNEDEHMRQFAENKQREESAARTLFANMHAGYFRSGFWNIDELISIAKNKIKNKPEDDKGAMRVAAILKSLEAIKKIYDDIDKQSRTDKKKKTK